MKRFPSLSTFSLAFTSALALAALSGQSQPFDIMSFGVTETGPWSDTNKTKLTVPKVAKGSIKLDANPSSAKYGGFSGVTVTPGVNAWILDYPADRIWDGAADSSFTYWLAHDDDFLYVGVDAKDDVVNSDDPNAAFWKDDSIEIVIDALNNRIDNNTDNANDKYGGHCYVNYLGLFSKWDDATATINGQSWSSGVDWTYGEDGDIFGFGKAVTGGWQMEVRFKKRLFEDPDAKNKLDNGYVMGFNIGLDDDDKTGLGTNGNGSRSTDLELQYFWANRERAQGLTAEFLASLTPQQLASKAYLADFPKVINANGRLSHGGTGEIVFAPAVSTTPAQLKISKSGTSLQVSWTGAGALQESGQVTGPWVNAASQANPQSITASGSSKFYRVRQ